MTMLGTIVVADDEALARQSVAEFLQEEGYQVYEAADGQAALQFLEQVDVDLILSDLRMPGLDGLALLQKVREVYPQTMVVLMTAYASVETVVEALRLGAQDYLLKPLLFDDLLHDLVQIRRILIDSQGPRIVQEILHQMVQSGRLRGNNVQKRLDFLFLFKFVGKSTHGGGDSKERISYFVRHS